MLEKKSINEEEKLDALLSKIEEIKRQKIDLQKTITQLEERKELLVIKK